MGSARDSRVKVDDLEKSLADARTVADAFERMAAAPIESAKDAWALGGTAASVVFEQWCVFRLLYSLGASRGELVAQFVVVLEAEEFARRLQGEVWSAKDWEIEFRFGRRFETYVPALWLVACGVALGVDDVMFGRVVSVVEHAHADRLVSRLIRSRVSSFPVGAELAFKGVVGRLDAVFESSRPVAAVGRYVGMWESVWSPQSYWIPPVIDPQRYSGYWSLEAAGVVAALGLDDSSLIGELVYPGDLVDRDRLPEAAVRAGQTDWMPGPDAPGPVVPVMRGPRPVTVSGATTVWAGLAAGCGAGSETVEWVGVAETDPAAYLAKFADELFQRDITEVSQVTGAVALVDGLIREGVAVEVDWKSRGVEVADLLRGFQIIDLQPGAGRGKKVAQALPFLAASAAQQGASIIEVDIDSDSHPLIIATTTPELPALVAAAPGAQLIPTP